MIQSLSPERLLIRGVLAVAWTSLLSKIFGVANQIVIAGTFGVGPEMDAFNASLVVPNLITITFAGAAETTLVPIYVRARAAGEPEAANRAFSSLATVCVLIFGLATGVAIVGAPTLLRLTAPGFEPERLDLALLLTPLVYPLVVVNILVGLLTGALNSQRFFARPNLMQIAVPLSILGTVLLLGGRLGVVALAAGQLLGVCIQVALLAAAARRAGIRYTPVIDLRSGVLRMAARQSIPIALASMIIHSNLFVDQVVASTLPAGQLSALNYALKLIDLPIVVVFTAFSRVTLPHFSEQVMRKQWSDLRESIRVSTWLMLGVTLSMTLGALVLGRPVISLLFQRGRFTAQDADAVFAVFAAAALGLAPMGVGFIIPRVFSALQRNELLTAITVFSVGANTALDLALAPRLGALGIALATGLVTTAALAIQLVVLSHLLGGFNAFAVPCELRARWRRLGP